MDKDGYDDGLAVRRQVLGDAWVDRSLAGRTPFSTEFRCNRPSRPSSRVDAGSPLGRTPTRDQRDASSCTNA